VIKLCLLRSIAIVKLSVEVPLGWRLSDNGSNKIAENALEEALIYRLGALGR
jgi:hypothetical protein